MALPYYQDAYTAKKENTIITIMSIAIVLSLIGAYVLFKSVREDCQQQDFTYCGDPVEHAHI